MAATQPLQLNSLFADHMVLQRDRPVAVWGTATPGERLTVSVAGKSAQTKAGGEGKWSLELPALSAGGPYELTVRGEGREKIFRDVMVGEVWIGSGQSNMEWPVSLAVQPQEEVASANFPDIRLFTVPKRGSGEPVDDVPGDWSVCSPETVGSFSAVLYFFGRHLHKTLGVPIGLIHTSWGGTPVEAWTSRSALRAEPASRRLVERDEHSEMGPTDVEQAKRELQRAFAEWEENVYHKDTGNEGVGRGWADGKFDDIAWKTMELPCVWQSAGLSFNGAVWFRRQVDVPAAWAGKELTLSLGAVDDFDTTYFNGGKIGGIGKETPNFWVTPRVYRVPGNLVKAGKNFIAVRVFDRGGQGGFAGVSNQMALSRADGESIPLAGPWRYQVEKEIPLLELAKLPPAPQPPRMPDDPWFSSSLFHGMLHPLIPYTIRGATWYQGESNANRAEQYRGIFSAMITDWRQRWGWDFPFLFVQLANWTYPVPEPIDSEWAELREAQALALRLPNTGMAVAIDVGDAADIHPRNKQEVGRRLALAAEATVYGREKVVYSGPHFRSAKVEGNRIRLSFDHVDGGLVAQPRRGDKTLRGFAIAGEDRKFVWAEAAIDGGDILVSSPTIARPVAVRYAWHANPDPANLYNAAGLPASPFRTDTWPMITAGKWHP
jgi:sialate O-acetylesterase